MRWRGDGFPRGTLVIRRDLITASGQTPWLAPATPQCKCPSNLVQICMRKKEEMRELTITCGQGLYPVQDRTRLIVHSCISAYMDSAGHLTLHPAGVASIDAMQSDFLPIRRMY
jgi:hypothetical protein